VIKGLHHIVLFCKDTEASKAWYEKAGFAYKHGYDSMHWFRFGEAEIMLHPADEVRRGTGPAVHAAVSDVDALFQHVKRNGLTPVDHQQGGRALEAPVTRPWGDREFELIDPDGYSWAFTERK
jgi:catechol 2,3-dioxygenase-like lactoylglutathione lyase family enzyme